MPRYIPGQVLQIKYARPGPHAGRYYHDFKPGVRMLANRDGSVTLRGRRKIHATEDEPGFWQKYGHGVNPPRRRKAEPEPEGGGSGLIWIAGAVLFYLWAKQSGWQGFQVTPASGDTGAGFQWPGTGGDPGSTVLF